MLRSLYIRNFVLIDEVEVQFEKGLSVITGETGAGKSIIFGALSLLKGKRAESDALKDKTSKCVLEARIDVRKYRLRTAFEAEDLDYYDEAIFRRELSPQGKSRAFINDTPVRLDQMQRLGDLLFDIHSQQESLELEDPGYRMEIIDEIAGSKDLLASYQAAYSEYKDLKKENEQLKELSLQSQQEQDYVQFQFDELDKLNLEIGEEEQLEKEHSLMANGESLLSNLEQFNQLMEEGEGAILGNLYSAANLIEELSRLYPNAGELRERFVSAQIELKDIAAELEGLKSEMDFDPARLQMVEERLAEIHHLKMKHAKMSGDELIAYHRELGNKLSSIDEYASRIEQNEALLKELRSKLDVLAQGLSEQRRSSFAGIEHAVVNSLKELGIPQASFKIERSEVELGANGIDHLDFLFSANLGLSMKTVKKVASGGEKSRIMLSIKRELAKCKQMPALFFDEIDTGVSGEVADQLGHILREMGDTHQILAITHLPQLAAKGRHHFFVYKEMGEDSTNTHIRKLQQDERVDEVAKMLSGETVSSAALNNAKELLAQ